MQVLRRGENWGTQGKPLRAEKTTNKLSPHMTLSLEIEPGPHWCEPTNLSHHCSPVYYRYIIKANYCCNTTFNCMVHQTNAGQAMGDFFQVSFRRFGLK